MDTGEQGYGTDPYESQSLKDAKRTGIHEVRVLNIQPISQQACTRQGNQEKPGSCLEDQVHNLKTRLTMPGSFII
jgi:hypothetical protein